MITYLVAYSYQSQDTSISGFGHAVISIRAPIATNDDVSGVIQLLKSRDSALDKVVLLNIQKLPII
jgi:hypothetical protein